MSINSNSKDNLKPIPIVEQTQGYPIPQAVTNVKQQSPVFTRSLSKRSRSTYTEINALEFKAFFDAIIKDGGGREVPFISRPDVKEKTLYQKLADAILYLAQETKDEQERAKYLLLKGTYKFVITHTSIQYVPKVQGIRNLLGVPVRLEVHSSLSQEEVVQDNSLQNSGITFKNAFLPENQSQPNPFSFKQKIEEFIEKGAYDTPYEIILPDTSNETLTIVSGICSGIPGLDYLCNGNKLTLIKMQIE